MKYDLDYISKNETWVPIEGYEGKYEVSSFGQIRSLNYLRSNKIKILKQSYCDKYVHISLWKNNISKTFLTHRLVATAFLPNTENLPCINHIDENPFNNNVSNLEWCSYEYNCNYGHHNENNSKSQLNGKNSKPVLQFNKNGDFIAEYHSIREVERKFGFNHYSISACCRGIKRYNTAYGFVWKYK